MPLKQHAFTKGCAVPAPEQASSHREDDDVLCDECADLDLEQAFTRAFALYEGARRETNTRKLAEYRQRNGPVYLGHFYYVTSLGDRLSHKKDCKLCDFLKQLTAEPAKGTYKLLAICSTESYLFEPGKMWMNPTKGIFTVEHNVFMAVVPEVPLIPKTGIPLGWLETVLPMNGSIYRLTQSWEADEDRIILPRELPVKADFALMRQWLSGCRNSHAKRCAPRKPAGISPRGFRVINCFKDPPVVEALSWSMRYVTLSYVWGPPSGDWPPTILDAVEVMRCLGEQYLWVDRLCIDQSNLDEKKILISKMDDIYEGAEFTIVCAAGDARTGLPGVLTTPRKLQPRVELNECIRSDDGIKVATATLASPDSAAELLGVREEEFISERMNELELPDRSRNELDGLEGGKRLNLDQNKIEKPLPPGKIAGKTILVSILQDPKISIRNSEWANRGWTYQEGVLSNRRLVFTSQQVYWECRKMTMNETIDFPLGIVRKNGTANYKMCGISEADADHVPELGISNTPDRPYYKIANQVLKLDGHISAFTSRKLSSSADSLNAFLGIAARYSSDCGLSLLLGIPIWTGPIVNGKHGLQHTFALSISDWVHTGRPVEERSEMYVADCTRRAQFPSWTWAGWQGPVIFSATIADDEEDTYHNNGDTGHGGFFELLTGDDIFATRDYSSMIWSAEMILHDVDSTESTLLSSWAPVSNTGDPDKRWLLTITEPLVLRNMYLMPSIIEGEWRRLMGRVVHVHLSVPMTEAELIAGHKRGELTTMLVFASSYASIGLQLKLVPHHLAHGIARFLILRRSNDEGTHWERIGRLNLEIERRICLKYWNAEELVAMLPVRKFGRDITLI